jgi:hypothetical protein
MRGRAGIADQPEEIRGTINTRSTLCLFEGADVVEVSDRRPIRTLGDELAREVVLVDPLESRNVPRVVPVLLTDVDPRVRAMLGTAHHDGTIGLSVTQTV